MIHWPEEDAIGGEGRAVSKAMETLFTKALLMSAAVFAFCGPRQPQGTSFGTHRALRSKGIFVGILATDASSNSEVCVPVAVGGLGESHHLPFSSEASHAWKFVVEAFSHLQFKHFSAGI